MREADLLALHERFPARYPVLLESVSGEVPLGRHDVLFALPGERLSQLPDGSLAGDVREAAAGGRFLDALDRWVARERGARGVATSGASSGAVFADGWFLYLGYELAGEIEPMRIELRTVLAVAGIFNIFFFVYPGPLVSAATTAAKSLFPG